MLHPAEPLILGQLCPLLYFRAPGHCLLPPPAPPPSPKHCLSIPLICRTKAMGFAHSWQTWSESPLQKPLSSLLLGSFFGHLVPCLLMPRGTVRTWGRPMPTAPPLLCCTQHGCGFLSFPLPVAFLHPSLSACRMDKPRPWLLRWHPATLDASLCPVCHAPWALAMGSHVAERGKAERWEEACPRLSTGAMSGPRQVSPCWRKGPW